MSELPDYWVIAPAHPDLVDVADEAAAIAESLTGSGIGAKLTQGDVTLRTLLDYVGSRERDGEIVPLTGMWFATHMQDGDVWLSNETIDAEQLAALLNTLGQPWLVINTCSSIAAVARIQAHAQVDIAYTIADVPDRKAWYFARMVAQNYHRYGENLRAAIYAASPGGNSLYRFLPAHDPSDRGDRALMPQQRTVEPTDDALRGEIRELQDTMYGNERRRTVGVVDHLRRINWWLLVITVLLLINLSIQVFTWLIVGS